MTRVCKVQHFRAKSSELSWDGTTPRRRHRMTIEVSIESDLSGSPKPLSSSAAQPLAELSRPHHIDCVSSVVATARHCRKALQHSKQNDVPVDAGTTWYWRRNCCRLRLC